ncbi:MAG: RNA 2',3'-cyclic phosphodiesterase [Alphaproteobacteria bacterium]|nr:RNA 2',3'-cyclic phosphodiesterase [Alphaproteobacteria bacterium]
MLIQGGVPGARWQSREQLHLTLSFIGEVDGRDAAMIDDALAAIRAPAFCLQLHGVGQFGEGRKSRSHALWAGARANPALEHLQRKVESAIRRVGAPTDSHKFTPHVTLARMRHPEPGRVVEWLTHHALYSSAEFDIGAFHLYSSKLTSDGSIYRIEQSYDLEGAYDEADN